jgi:hypothetical protein
VTLAAPIEVECLMATVLSLAAHARSLSRDKGELAMTRKLAFMLAVSVTFGAVPQNAHALCSGGACNSFSVEGKNYSTSEKRVKVQRMRYAGQEMHQNFRL